MAPSLPCYSCYCSVSCGSHIHTFTVTARAAESLGSQAHVSGISLFSTRRLTLPLFLPTNFWYLSFSSGSFRCIYSLIHALLVNPSTWEGRIRGRKVRGRLGATDERRGAARVRGKGWWWRRMAKESGARLLENLKPNERKRGMREAEEESHVRSSRQELKQNLIRFASEFVLWRKEEKGWERRYLCVWTVNLVYWTERSNTSSSPWFTSQEDEELCCLRFQQQEWGKKKSPTETGGDGSDFPGKSSRKAVIVSLTKFCLNSELCVGWLLFSARFEEKIWWLCDSVNSSR